MHEKRLVLTVKRRGNKDSRKIRQEWKRFVSDLCKCVCFFVQLWTISCSLLFFDYCHRWFLFAVFIFYCMVMYLLIPLAPQVLDIVLPLLNGSRQRVFLYHTEYYVDNESHYYAIMLHSYSATLMQVSIIVATDAMFAVYVQHTCGKFAIVGWDS